MNQLACSRLTKVDYYTDKSPIQFLIWPVDDRKKRSWTSISLYDLWYKHSLIWIKFTIFYFFCSEWRMKKLWIPCFRTVSIRLVRTMLYSCYFFHFQKITTEKHGASGELLQYQPIIRKTHQKPVIYECIYNIRPIEHHWKHNCTNVYIYVGMLCSTVQYRIIRYS